jgi:hypothetical protein
MANSARSTRGAFGVIFALMFVFMAFSTLRRDDKEETSVVYRQLQTSVTAGAIPQTVGAQRRKASTLPACARGKTLAQSVGCAAAPPVAPWLALLVSHHREGTPVFTSPFLRHVHVGYADANITLDIPYTDAAGDGSANDLSAVHDHYGVLSTQFWAAQHYDLAQHAWIGIMQNKRMYDFDWLSTFRELVTKTDAEGRAQLTFPWRNGTVMKSGYTPCCHAYYSVNRTAEMLLGLNAPGKSAELRAMFDLHDIIVSGAYGAPLCQWKTPQYRHVIEKYIGKTHTRTVFSHKLGHMHNMFIAPPAVFRQYSDWLFGLFERLEHAGFTGEYRLQDHFGECFLTMFLIAHPQLRVLAIPVLHLTTDTSLEKPPRAARPRPLLRPSLRTLNNSRPPPTPPPTLPPPTTPPTEAARDDKAAATQKPTPLDPADPAEADAAAAKGAVRPRKPAPRAGAPKPTNADSADEEPPAAGGRKLLQADADGAPPPPLPPPRKKREADLTTHDELQQARRRPNMALPRPMPRPAAKRGAPMGEDGGAPPDEGDDQPRPAPAAKRPPPFKKVPVATLPRRRAPTYDDDPDHEDAPRPTPAAGRRPPQPEADDPGAQAPDAGPARRTPRHPGGDDDENADGEPIPRTRRPPARPVIVPVVRRGIPGRPEKPVKKDEEFPVDFSAMEANPPVGACYTHAAPRRLPLHPTDGSAAEAELPLPLMSTNRTEVGDDAAMAAVNGSQAEARQFVSLRTVPADLAGALQALYGLFAFAAASDRVALFPQTEAGSVLDGIVDVPRLRAAVIGLNIVWRSPTAHALDTFAADAVDLPAGYAGTRGSEESLRQRGTSPRNRVVVLDEEDVLAAPSLFAPLPIGDPAYVFGRYTSFTAAIRDSASAILQRSGKRLLSLHVPTLANVTPEALNAFVQLELEPRAAQSKCDGVYIAGAVSDAELAALRQLTTLKIATQDGRAARTAKVAEAIDVAVMQHSSVVIGIDRQHALLELARSRRCAAHHPVTLRFSKMQWKRFAMRPSTLVAPPPGQGLASKFPSVPQTYQDEGVYATELLPFDIGFAQLHRLPC